MYDNYGYSYNYDYTNYDSASSMLGVLSAISGTIAIISLVAGVISLVSQWKIYKKAGKKGWECLIPIYNIIVLLQIVELPIWYIVLFLVPFANIYAIFKIYIELAHKFGKSTGFGVATVFFNIICLPILAFGKNNVYNGGNNINTQITNSQNDLNNTQLNNLNTSNNNNNNNSNVQEPISFNQNINTEIRPINPLPQQVNNPMPSVVNNSNQNTEPQNNQSIQGLNVIPNTTTTLQPIENESIANNSNEQINLNQPVSSSFEYKMPSPTSSDNQTEPSQSSQIEQTIPTPITITQSELNVIPSLGTTPQPVENNSVNNLNNQFGVEQPKTTPFEYTNPSMTPNIQSENPKSEPLNSELTIPNPKPTQGLNVIPNMGVPQQSQNLGQDPRNNQNM